MPCQFVPPYLLERIAASRDVAAAATCHRTLAIDVGFRTARAAAAVVRRGAAPTERATGWTVHTAGNTTDLPGTPVRTQGQPASGDAAVDEAWARIEGSVALFGQVYGHTSYDGRGAVVSATVHYEEDYANAFWDGRNLVFGDGDGRIFDRFTKPVDVLGHEFTHAVTQHTAGLVYRDQSGALNESVSDVFAACLKQRLLGQSAVEGDWLIGAGLFLPGVEGRALRSMSEPGTAYDDPVLGKDPQPAHMDGFVVTADDNGGVHLNSGIPNRAFHLAAVAIGGTAAEGAGRVWWAALTGGAVGPETDFAGFAAATVAAAGEHAPAVEEAWSTVGVVPAGSSSAPPPGPPRDLPGPDVVEVRRSGGLLGRTTSGQVDLSGDDPRAPEVRELLTRVDLEGVAPGPAHPDAFTYEFCVEGRRVAVGESDLTDELRRLARLVLDRPHHEQDPR